MKMFSDPPAAHSKFPGNEAAEGTFVRNAQRSGSLASLCARPFVITQDEDGNEYVDTVRPVPNTRGGFRYNHYSEVLEPTMRN